MSRGISYLITETRYLRKIMGTFGAGIVLSLEITIEKTKFLEVWSSVGQKS